MTAYIGLGSNLENPPEQVQKAFQALDQLPATECVKHSGLFLTHPVGPQDQPDFINAVVKLETGLAPEQLLDELQRIEQTHLRVRKAEQWAPRTLDLDLLLYGQQQIATARLRVPHPRMTGRAFVLYPLAEVAPLDLRIPGYGTLGDLLQRVPSDGVQRL
ncbi:MAG: 2-amino-4-hydroxy-6-hydroxymethyldihydropteridine diphosphokinase [Pseudomonadota bacterium]